MGCLISFGGMSNIIWGCLVFELDFSVLDGCHEVLKISAFLYEKMSDLLPDGIPPADEAENADKAHWDV